jgi:hypothetical protein
MNDIVKAVLSHSNFFQDVRYYVSCSRDAESLLHIKMHMAAHVANMYGMLAFIYQDEVKFVVYDMLETCILVSRNPSQEDLGNASFIAYTPRGVVAVIPTPGELYNAVTGVANASEGTGDRQQEEDTSLQYYSNSVH